MMLSVIVIFRPGCEGNDVECKGVYAMIFNRCDCESNDVEYKDVNAMIFNRSDRESNDVECKYSLPLYSFVLIVKAMT